MGDAGACWLAQTPALPGRDGAMPIRVEIYGASGVAVGLVARAGRLREILESEDELLVEGVAWHPLDGTPPRPGGSLSVAGDDILIAAGDRSDDGPVHAQWHDVVLDVGPYRVTGQMPTMPGFDPGRALARPSGEFVLLRDVRISLLTDPEGVNVSQAEAVVNRYVVDRVTADLMLGFFFPGAQMELTDGSGLTSIEPGTTDPSSAQNPPAPAAPIAVPAANG